MTDGPPPLGPAGADRLSAAATVTFTAQGLGQPPALPIINVSPGRAGLAQNRVGGAARAGDGVGCNTSRESSATGNRTPNGGRGGAMLNDGVALSGPCGRSAVLSLRNSAQGEMPKRFPPSSLLVHLGASSHLKPKLSHHFFSSVDCWCVSLPSDDTRSPPAIFQSKNLTHISHSVNSHSVNSHSVRDKLI